MEPVFFDSPAAFRAWLVRHHAKEKELFVGFWKVGTGKPSMSWGESVDEALCFGWIDGLRRSLGADAYCVRFTPRKPGSAWSKVNVERAEAAIRAKRMRTAGLAAYRARDAAKDATASHDRAAASLTPAQEEALQAKRAAWADWQRRPPSYRKAAALWVNAAKRESTRAARLAALVDCSAAGKVIPPCKWSTSNPGRRRPRAGA